MEPPIKRPEKIKLAEINPYLTCYLCKGYLIDATTISECLHSFCRSCIIKFLQDNSYCPVCEVIINKAKPNLKLDKTLQDIVYKLVPELFLREMTRRKAYYQQYPQIAARVSPEERGEDIERTIFNPQDCISLSMEYVSDDSTPGAISLIDSKNGFDKKQLAEDTQTLMKRYLQCPGMCRIEVLKKFVRNKYNVDTSLFYIDILYKKVPLPDHYTLIDIAYIYSWKRNEPMKFYFRIIDINKVSERFDHFNSQTPLDFVKTPIKTPRSNGDRSVSHKRRESAGKRSSRICKQASQENITTCDAAKADLSPKPQSNLEIRCESDISQTSTESESKTISNKENKIIDNKENEKIYDKVDLIPKVPPERPCNTSIPEETLPAIEEKKSPDPVPKPKQKEDSSSSNPCDTTNKDNKVLGVQNMLLKSEIADQIKHKIQTEKSDVKNAVYTNITLNRTNNVEIITKIQKVSNKDGRPIGLNIIKQTVKKSSKGHSDSNNVTKPTKKLANIKPETSNKNNNLHVTDKPVTKSNLMKGSEVTSTNNNNTSLEDEEKMRFLQSIELTAKTIVQDIVHKQKELPQPSGGQKRKNSSPVKNDKTKRFKLDQQKPTTKIIIHSKPKATTSQPVNQMKSNGLQSLIENCKIPSSLSITIKEGTDNNRLPALIPPVKNYIEILKLPDENGQTNDKLVSTPTKLDFNMICDNDSEQKVDEDLSEIAKSLTEKIPMSTTISQIVGPKPQFPIPVKSNVPVKFNIQPSPVPEVSSKVLNIPKENKLNPRSPQTFQKIFEESIKKPDGSTSPDRDDQKSALDLSNDASSSTNSNNNSKRNILEIASQLYKKTKLEQEKKNSEVKVEEVATPVSIPKVPIPRLPNQRNLKPPQKNAKFELTDPMNYPLTLTNLHSNALGLNYTISIGHNTAPKKNGIVTPPKKEIKTASLATKMSPTPVPGKDTKISSSPAPFATPRDIPSASPRPSPIPRNLSPGLGYHSPRNSPKHSPKSSPLVKHMYAPMPNLMMDQQLRVHTYNQKIPSPKMSTFSKSPKLPSPSTSTSGKLPSPSSKKTNAISPRLPNLSPNLSPVAGSSPKLHHPLPSTSPKLLSLPELTSPCLSVKPPSKNSPGGSQSSPLSPNQILEKYNIQNLAQLTASLNFNAGNFGLNPTNQLAALQHAMLLKHFEMQNRQNWLNMNQGPLLQYEKYLQSLKNNQNHLLSKEN